MNTQDNPRTTPQTTANGATPRGIREAVGQSAEKAVAAIKVHPYFTAGVVTGIGLAVGAGLLLRARRRRSFFEVLMSRF
jgi:ElaB/YqjD/DUF883 family membrane-anchored ribosome-binding protein